MDSPRRLRHFKTSERTLILMQQLVKCDPSLWSSPAHMLLSFVESVNHEYVSWEDQRAVTII